MPSFIKKHHNYTYTETAAEIFPLPFRLEGSVPQIRGRFRGQGLPAAGFRRQLLYPQGVQLSAPVGFRVLALFQAGLQEPGALL